MVGVPLPWTAGSPRRFKKAFTFSNVAGGGQTGTVAVATITGAVALLYGSVRCTTTLVGSGATISLGTTNNATGLCPLTTASNITTGKFWQSTTPDTECSPMITYQVVDGNLIFTIGTATITAGVLEVVFYWVPISDTAAIA